MLTMRFRVAGVSFGAMGKEDGWVEPSLQYVSLQRRRPITGGVNSGVSSGGTLRRGRGTARTVGGGSSAFGADGELGGDGGGGELGGELGGGGGSGGAGGGHVGRS